MYKNLWSKVRLWSILEPLFLKNIFSLSVTVNNRRESFFFHRSVFRCFTKVVGANHSSVDMVFLRRVLATINCIYTMYWKIFLFNAYCYFNRELAATHFSGLYRYSRRPLLFKQALAFTPSFKDIELIR